MMDGGMMGGGYGGGTGVIGGLLMLVFWVAIIVGVILLVLWLVRQTTGGQIYGSATHYTTGESTKGESALDIIRSRYARGEIDKAEFEEKKKDLTG